MFKVIQIIIVNYYDLYQSSIVMGILRIWIYTVSIAYFLLLTGLFIVSALQFLSFGGLKFISDSDLLL